MSFIIRLFRGSIVVALVLLVIWIIWYIGLEDKSEYFVKTRKLLEKIRSLKSNKRGIWKE